MSERYDKLIELLSAYLDGEVTPREREKVKELLRTDPEARALYAKLEKTRNLLNDIYRLPAPETLKHHVLHQLSMSRGRRTNFFGRMRETLLPARIPTPLLTYAGAVLVIGAVVWIAATMFLSQPPGMPAAPSDQFATAVSKEKDVAEEDLEESEKFASVEDVEEKKSTDDVEESIVDDRMDDQLETFAQATPAEAEGRLEEEILHEPAVGEEATVGGLAQRGETVLQADETERKRAAKMETSRPAAPTMLADRSVASAGAMLSLDHLRPAVFRASERSVIPGRGDAFALDKYFYVSETETHIAERGSPRQLDPSAPPGSDGNPLFDPRIFAPPQFLSFEFIGSGVTPVQQEVQAFVQAHIAKNGVIIYLRLVSHANSRQLIEALADRLMATRLIPAQVEQDPISVFYSFVVVIRPASEGAALAQ